MCIFLLYFIAEKAKDKLFWNAFQKHALGNEN